MVGLEACSRSWIRAQSVYGFAVQEKFVVSLVKARGLAEFSEGN